MTKPFEIPIGPFKGMMTTSNNAYAQPDEAATAFSIDYTDGSLRGIYTPGTPNLTGVAAGKKFIHHRDGVGWTTADTKNFYCFDGMCNVGPAGKGVSYYTNVVSSVPGQPLVTAGTNWVDKPLGIAAPTALTATNGTGQARAYRITYVYQLQDLNVTWESNPSPIATTTGATGAVLSFTAMSASPTGATYSIRVYASDLGTQAAPFKFVTSISPTATTWTDAPYSASLPIILLNWDAGGSPSSTLYPYDHSPSPSLYVVANALLGVPATAASVSVSQYGGARAGILFGANYSTLYWSATGYPWYWPGLNAEDLDDIVEAIIVNRAVAYAFTRSGVYAISGTVDTALTITRTASPFGVLPQGGPAVVQTPYGIVFPCRDGLAAFDGFTSRIISSELVPPGTITAGGNVIFGAYQDGIYLISTDVVTWTPGSLAFDLRRFPNVNLCAVNNLSTYKAFAKVQPHATTGLNNNGLYVLDASGNISPWSPVQGGNSATRDAAWSHTTGYLTAGELTRKKEYSRVWAAYTGTAPSILAKCYTWAGTLVSSFTLSGSGYLPAAMTGDYLTLTITAADATTNVIGLRVLGTVLES